ncbi:MAG: undecaprenyl-phosphate glucose phosphotransferase [Oligoflexia bacterium]|nr:undecaprenyl-phosphate glucose phosphotransferase [Oligoflexia bacterium]
MTRHEKHSLIQIQFFLDALSIFIAWFLAYYIRFNVLPDGQSGLLPTFLQISPIVIIITLYIFTQNGIYQQSKFDRSANNSSRYSNITTALKANLISFIVLVILFYFFSREKISRVALLNYFILSQFFLFTSRYTLRKYIKRMRKRGKLFKNILLVGNAKELSEYVKLSKRRERELGYRFIGWIDSEENESEKYNIETINISDYLKRKTSIDTIVIAYSGDKSYKVNEFLKDNYSELVEIEVLPEVAFNLIGYQITSFNHIPVISINEPNLGLIDYFAKRSFDFIFTFIGLIIISPFLLLISIMIKITSPGPIFYAQERTGLDGKLFKMWKFRSMKIDAEKETGAVWCIENDPRRTRFGSFLRRTSIDELPQLWNVLIGDMSLVGPRPERPIFVDQFKDKIPNYMLRHKMKTGITGWAQVNGWRGNTELEGRIECDIFYIKNWSIWLDIKIIFLTFWKGFVNKNAY